MLRGLKLAQQEQARTFWLAAMLFCSNAVETTVEPGPDLATSSDSTVHTYPKKYRIQKFPLACVTAGNLLMSTVVLTLESLIALWMFDFPTMVWIYTTWQTSGFLRFLSLAELYTKRLQTLSVSGLTELQNSLECWRLAALIYLFSEQNGC